MVLDNNTADPIFVIGAEDQPQQAITPVAPRRSAHGDADDPRRSHPDADAARRATRPRSTWARAASTIFQDQASGNNTTTINVGATVHWVWVDSDALDDVGHGSLGLGHPFERHHLRLSVHTGRQRSRTTAWCTARR